MIVFSCVIIAQLLPNLYSCAKPALYCAITVLYCAILTQTLLCFAITVVYFIIIAPHWVITEPYRVIIIPFYNFLVAFCAITVPSFVIIESSSATIVSLYAKWRPNFTLVHIHYALYCCVISNVPSLWEPLESKLMPLLNSMFYCDLTLSYLVITSTYCLCFDIVVAYYAFTVLVINHCGLLSHHFVLFLHYALLLLHYRLVPSTCHIVPVKCFTL
jgi:hypothetical protein